MRRKQLWTKEELDTLYWVEGKSATEIAKQFQCDKSTVLAELDRLKIPRRPYLPGSPIGNLNHQWKGDNATIISFHQRLNALFGQPRYCEHCGSKTARNYDWANDTGKYEDPYDYIRLCRSCHRKFDYRK